MKLNCEGRSVSLFKDPYLSEWIEIMRVEEYVCLKDRYLTEWI